MQLPNIELRLGRAGNQLLLFFALVSSFFSGSSEASFYEGPIYIELLNESYYSSVALEASDEIGQSFRVFSSGVIRSIGLVNYVNSECRIRLYAGTGFGGDVLYDSTHRLKAYTWFPSGTQSDYLEFFDLDSASAPEVIARRYYTLSVSECASRLGRGQNTAPRFTDGTLFLRGESSTTDYYLQFGMYRRAAPIVVGLDDLSATEDTKSALDLSALSFPNTGQITVSVDSGLLFAADGDGTVSGVTVSGSNGESGSASLTFSGSATALANYFDNTAKLAYLTAANATAPVGLSIVPSSGDVTGYAKSSQILITPVADAPTIAGVDGESVTTSLFSGSVRLFQADGLGIAYPDSANLNGYSLTVEITDNHETSQDLIAIVRDASVTLSTGTSGVEAVIVEGENIGTLGAAIAAGNTLEVALNSAATPARAVTLLKNIIYENTAHPDPTASTRSLAVSLSNGIADSSTVNVDLIVRSRDADASISAAEPLSEPIGIPSTQNSASTYLGLLDFHVSDGGSADGLATNIKALELTTGGTLDPSLLDFTLSGDGLTTATGVYAAGKLTFSDIGLSVADGGGAVFTVSARFKSETPEVEDGQTLTLSLNGEDSATLAAGSSKISGSTAVTNGSGSVVEVTATELRFLSSPGDSVSGVLFATPIVVAATDAYGNTDVDWWGMISLYPASGSGAWQGTRSASSSRGRLTVGGARFLANSDNTTVTLRASVSSSFDYGAGRLTEAISNPFVVDVLATKLEFKNATVFATWGRASDFVGPVVVHAVDARGILDTDYEEAVSLSTAWGWANGSGSLGRPVGADKVGPLGPVTASGGVASVSELRIIVLNYGLEATRIKASSGSLSPALSSPISVSDPVSTGTRSPKPGRIIAPGNTAGQTFARMTPSESTRTTPFIIQSFTVTTPGVLTTVELATGFGSDTNCLLEITGIEGVLMHREPVRIRGSYAAGAGTAPGARSAYHLAGGGVALGEGDHFAFRLKFCTFPIDYYLSENEASSAYLGGGATLGRDTIDGADLAFALIITEPTEISGLPSVLSAVEDEPRAVSFNDVELTGSNRLVLTVDRGRLSSTAGAGTFAGVTVGVGIRSLDLQGTAAALRSFLADPSRMTFTSDLDDSRDAILTLTPRFNFDAGDAKTVAIEVAAVNDAPTIDAFDLTTAAITEDTRSTLGFSAINFDDRDDDTLTVTLSTDKGLLFASDGAAGGAVDGVTITTAGSEGGKTSIELTGKDSSLTSYFASADKFAFQPALDDTSDHTLTLTYTDGTAAARSSSAVLEITAVRDSPRIAAGGFARQTILEDESRILDFSEWDIRAPDSETVTFTLSAVNSEATFRISGGNRSNPFVTVTGSGSDAMSISASPSFLLRTLDGSETITLTPKANATGMFFFGVTLSDENGPSTGEGSGTAGVWTRTAVDDLPVISNLNGDASNFVPGFGSQALDVGGDATIFDVEIALETEESLNGHSLHIAIADNHEPLEDLLSLASDDRVSRTGDTAGSSVSVGGVTVGTLTSAIGLGNALEVALNEAATIDRVQALLRAATYSNEKGESASNSARGIDFWFTNAADTASNKSRVTLRVQRPNSNGSLAAAAGITEPVQVSTTAVSTPILDFTLADGGGDGYPIKINSLTFRLSGSLDPRSMVFRLDGPGVVGSERVGSYDHDLGTLDFPASFEIADASSAVFTLSVSFDERLKSFGTVEGNTLIVSASPADDFNLVDGGSGFADASVTLNGSGTTLDVEATELVLLRAPDSSISGTAFEQQVSVAAQDAYGNTDRDFVETVSLSTHTGSGSLFGSLTTPAVAGVASFTDTGYTAAVDGETFGLTIDDDTELGTNLAALNTATLKSDIRASRLVFAVQPGPSRVNVATMAWRDPVVHAVDSRGVRDVDFENSVSLRRTAGSGATAVSSTTLTSTGDGLGLTATAAEGVATFTGLRISYTPTRANDSFRYRAEADGLSSADSDPITANAIPSASALPGGLEASEDVTSELNLSSVDFTDLDGESLAVVLSINRGKLIAADGDGAVAGITVAGSGGSAGSAAIRFTGTPSALSSFFDSRSRLAYRGPLNDSTDATLSLAIEDDEISGITRSATVAVAAVNDPPTVTNIEGQVVNYDTAFNEWVLDNERRAIVADVDSDNFDGGFLRVAITENKQASEDLLSFIDYFGKGISFGTEAGSTVYIDFTTAIGTLAQDIAAGNDLVVNFNSAATPARVQELVQAVYYDNVSAGAASTEPRRITLTLSDGEAQNSYSLTLNTIIRDRDATFSAAASPLSSATVITDSTAFTPALNFKLADGGTGDGIATRITRISFNVDGPIEPRILEAQLSGPGLAPTLAEDAGGRLAFDLSAAPLVVDNGEAGEFTISLRLKAETVIDDGTEFKIEITDLEFPETAINSTLLSAAPLEFRSEVTVDVVASTYEFSTQPSDSVSGETFAAGLVVDAVDAAGNRDTDYSDEVQLSTTAGGSLVNSWVAAEEGRAAFPETYYLASRDNQLVSLVASDTPSAGTDLTSVTSLTFTSRVNASTLKFITQPSPLEVVTGSTFKFTDAPVVAAIGAGDVVDEDFAGRITVTGYNFSPASGSSLLEFGDASAGNSKLANTGAAEFPDLEFVFAAAENSGGYFFLLAKAEGLSQSTSAEIKKADIAALGGFIESITIDEDTLTAFDYTAIKVTSKNNESITLTFSIDEGTLSTLHEPGTVEGVVISEITETDGILSVSFTGTGAALTDYLRREGSLKFQSALDQRGFTYLEVHAGSGDSTRKIAEATITINPVNDAPTLSGLADATQTYTPGVGAVHLSQLSAAVFSDPDSWLSAGSSIEVEITAGLVGGEDRLALRALGDESLVIETGDEAAVRIDGRVVGFLAEPFAEGRKIRLAIPRSITNASVQALLRRITYENTNTEDPTASTREVSITLSDGEATTVYRVDVQVLAAPADRDPPPAPDPAPAPDADPAPAPGPDPVPPSAPDPAPAPDPDPAPIEVPAPGVLGLEGLDTRYPLKLVIKSGTPPYTATVADPELGHLRVEGNVIYLRGARKGITQLDVTDSVGEEISASLEFRPWERAHSAGGFSNYQGPVSAASFLGGVSKDGGVIYSSLEDFSVGDTFHLFFHINPREQDLFQEVQFVVAVIDGRRPDEVLLLNDEGRTVPYDGETLTPFASGVLTRESIIDVTTNQPLELTRELRGDWFIFVGYALPSGEIIYPREATTLRVR